MRRRQLFVKEYVKKHWLIGGILFCIFLASIFPKLGSKQGPLKTEYTVKYGAVSIIFFISGLSLNTELLLDTFHNIHIHVFVQIFTFVFIPVATLFVVKILFYMGLNPWILKGLLTVSCMPPPVSSAVILTRSALGNETAAIFNSVIGSFLGIIITPILLLFFLGATAVVPLIGTLIQLGTSVILPLMIGKAVGICTNYNKHKRRLHLNTLGQVTLLFIIYTTFCDTFHTPEMGLTALDIIITVFLVVTMQVCFVGASFRLSGYFKSVLSREDRVAVLFCSTHKSLTLGIPILRIMFYGFSHLSQISLPLLVYHPTQIILGGFMVSHLKNWISDYRYGQKKGKLPL